MMMPFTAPVCALLQELDVQLRACSEELFHVKEQLQAQKTKEKDCVAQALRSKSTITSLNNQLGQLNKDMIQQQKTINKLASLPTHKQTHACKLVT